LTWRDGKQELEADSMPGLKRTEERVRKVCEDLTMMTCTALLPYAAASMRIHGSKPVWFALWAFIGAVSSYWLAPIAGYLALRALSRTRLGTGYDRSDAYSPTPFPERLLRGLLVGMLGFVIYYFFFQ
jgi:hypothetical protein